VLLGDTGHVPRTNIEIARQLADGINAREVPDDLFAPDFLLENVRTAVTDTVYRGPAGARRWLSDFFGVLDDDARFELEEAIAAARRARPFGCALRASYGSATGKSRGWLGTRRAVRHSKPWACTSSGRGYRICTSALSPTTKR
jgi:hypothetical protein